MSQLLQFNVLNEQVRAPIPVDRRRRRLSAVVRRHAPKDRPYIVSVHRLNDPLRATDLTVKLRKQWKETLVGRDDTVVITHLPLGGGGGSSSGKQIGAALAMLALTLAVPWALGAAVPALAAAGGGLTLAGKVIAAGIVLGGAYLIGQITKPKADTSEDNRPVFGVSGGGNLPRPGDRIPVLYGRHWVQPDLTQPDYFVYDGEDMVLYKRVTLTPGKANPKAIRVGPATLWTVAGGVQAPFNGSGDANGSGLSTAVEVIQPGGTSTLVPGTVYSSPSVGGQEIPRPWDVPAFQGPFPSCPVGKTSSRLQLDFSFPAGLLWNKGKDGQVASTGWLRFEAAPCDDNDNPIGAYTTLLEFVHTTKSTRALRFTRFVDVANGRYLVRVRNMSQNGEHHLNDATWDGLRAHFPETITRPCTEIALRVRSGKSTGTTSFSDVWVDAARVLPVWDGSAWVEQETRKAVWAYADILRASYGGNLPDNEIDVGTLLSRAGSLSQYATFDGVIRGPVSVWDAASAVLGVMRAEPTRLGQVWSLNRDEQKAISRHIVTRRQIVRGTSSVNYKVDASDGSADVVVEFYVGGDPRKRREARSTFGAQSITPQRLNLQGVTDWDHAYHIATWMAACAYFRRRRRLVTVEMQGRLLRRGDPARIDAWFLSASRRAAGVLSRAGLELVLDTDVEVGASTYLVARNRRGREFGPIKVTAGSAANVVVLDAGDLAAAEADAELTLGQALARDGEDMTSVLIGEYPNDPFIIDAVEPRGKARVAVEAVHDAPEVWTALGEVHPSPPTVPSLGDEAEPSYATVPWVRARPVQKTNSLEIEWAVGSARGAVAYIVDLSYDAGGAWEEVSHGLSTSGLYAIRHEEGISVTVRARAVNRHGLVGPSVQTILTTFRPIITENTASIEFSAFDARVRERIKQGETGLRSAYSKGAELIDVWIKNKEDSDRWQGEKRVVEQITSVSAARITQAEEAIANEVEARATVVTALEAQIGEAHAAIVSEAQARATADEAVASSVETLGVTVGTHSANITNLFSATATINGKLNLTSGLVFDVNGRITGRYVYADNTTTSVVWLADAFTLAAPGVGGGAPQQMFAAESIGGVIRLVLNGNVYVRKVQSFDGKMIDDYQNGRREIWD